MYAFPFVFKRDDSLRDCQEQLIRAVTYSWVWSLPDHVPFPMEEKSALLLDVIKLYEQGFEAGCRNLSVTDALDGIGMKAAFLQSKRKAAKWAFGMVIQHDVWTGYLCNGLYNPSLVDGGFAARLLKGMARELETLLKGETE